MELDRLYIEALNIPAIEFKLNSQNLNPVYKNGKILTAAYTSTLKEVPQNKHFLIFKHSQNLFSFYISNQKMKYILGPIILTDAIAENHAFNGESKTIYLPQLLTTYSVEKKQSINQILMFTKLIGLNLTITEIKEAFDNPTKSNQFNDKLILVNFNDEGAHVSYAYEKALKTAVELGKPSMVHDAFIGLVNSGRIGILSDESNLRNVKNWGIICTSVTLRAAINTGMDYDKAYSLNDHYVRTLEALNSYDEVMTMIEKMVVDMAQRVNQLKSVHLSTAVRRAHQIIMNTPETRITIEELANQLGLSPHNLSTNFKKEVGLTITRFKILVKINRTIEILHTTNLPLSEISDILNFSDQAHLTREFVKFVGVTPSRARRNPHLVDDWHLYNFVNINVG